MNMPDVARPRMTPSLRRLLAFAAFCAMWKLVFAFAPESAVLAQFCRVPAEVAAFYYGVPLDVGTLSFTARGVTLAVTRACAATDFFSLVAATFLTARVMREGARVGGRLRDLRDLLLAWAITLAVNSLRIIALVPVDAVFPKDHAPIVHILVGVSFFLPVFVFLWYNCFKTK